MSSYARAAPPPAPPEGSIPFPQSSPRSRARDFTEVAVVHGTPSKYRRGEGSVRRESQSSPSNGLPGINNIFKLDRDAGDTGGHDAMELEAAQALMTAKERAAARSDASSDDLHSRHASAIAMLSMASSHSNPDVLGRRPPYGHASMGSDPAGAYRRPQLKVDAQAAQHVGPAGSGEAALPSPFARRRHTLGASDEPILSPGAAAASAAAEQRTPSRTPRSGKRSFNSQLDSPTTPTMVESNRRYASDATPVHSHIYLRGQDAPTGSLPSLALAELTSPRGGHARNSSFKSQGNTPLLSRVRPPAFTGGYGSSRSDLASPRTSAGALSFSSSGWHSRSSTLESVETPISSPAYTKLPHDVGAHGKGHAPGHSHEGTSPPSALQASEDQLRHRFESMRAFPASGRWEGEAVGFEDAAGAPAGPRPRARTMSAAGRPMARLPGTAASQQQGGRSQFAPTHSRHDSYELDMGGAGPSSRASVMDVDEDVDEEAEDDAAPAGSESWRRQGRPRIDSGDSTGSMARPGSSANRPISPQGSSIYRPMSRDSVASAGGTIVSGMAKYECSWCGKRFSRPSSLKIHHHSHTGDKPFVCHEPGCGRAFSVQSNLRRHQKCHGSGSGGGSVGSGGAGVGVGVGVGASNQNVSVGQPQSASVSHEHFRPPQPPGDDRTRYGMDGAPGSAPASMSPSRHGSLRGMRTGPPPSAGAPGPMAAPSSAGPGIPAGSSGFHHHTSTSGYPMPFAPMHMHGHPPLSRSAYEPGSRSFALPWPSIPGSHAGAGGPRFAAGPGLGLAESHAQGMHSSSSSSSSHHLYQQSSFRGPPGALASSAPAHTQAFSGAMSSVRPPSASFARARDRRQSASSSVGGDEDEGVRIRSALLASGPLSSSRFSTTESVAATSSDGDDDLESPPLEGGPQLGRSGSLSDRRRRDTATSTMRKGFEGLLNPQR